MRLIHKSEDIIADKYQILDILGQGGSSVTYAVQHLSTNENIALKSLCLHWVKDWKVVELFEREGKILSQLNHPAIPRYLEYFYIDTPSNRSFYIAQQLAPGKSLAMMVENGWRTTEQEVRDIAIQVLKVLKYLHSLTPPVVHRDIKPQNIIRGEDGKVFLVDFGAVQQTYHDTFMRGSTVVGTYGYMAPEQFRSLAVPATDLYGLAATLLYLLTHRSPAELPSDGLQVDICSCIQVSEHFTAWLEKMLEPDLEERFRSAAEALNVLLYEHPIKSKNIVKKPKVWLKLLFAVVSVTATIYSLELFNNAGLEILSKVGLNPVINKVSLNQAVENGDEKLTKKLVANGANVNQVDEDSFTPLLTIAKLGKNQKIAHFLIEAGANVKAKNKFGDTALHLLVNHQNIDNRELIKTIIDKNADINVYNLELETPLHLVKDEQIAELLLSKGADINAKDVDGNTPLHKQYNENIVIMLINKGANINIKNKAGKTPLLTNVELVRNINIVQLLVDKGADINVRNEAGDTPLHFLVPATSDESKIKKLLEAGANINAQNNDGNIPLHVNITDEMASFLIDNGADANIKNNQGLTPLQRRKQIREQEQKIKRYK